MVFDNRTAKTYHNTKMQTHRTELFEEQYQRWYPNGKKIVPQDVALTPLSLAIWFADDGIQNKAVHAWI
jgi:hypothetical protein